MVGQRRNNEAQSCRLLWFRQAWRKTSMAFCVSCGDQVREGAAFCTKCGARTAVPVQSAAPTAPNRTIMVVQKQKSSGVAAILSFFWCGLGQIYNGQIAKGLLFMILYPPIMWFGMVLSFFGAAAAGGANNSSDQAAGAGAAVFGLGLLVIGGSLWVFGMVNAYRTAERLNDAQLRFQ